MRYYHERYPDNLSAIQLYVAEHNSDLPQGLYAFLELYCDNPDCACQQVVIKIVKQSSENLDYFEDSKKPIVTLRYKWNLPLSDQNPRLDKEDYQSKLADMGRQVFVNYVEAAPHYNDELASRFQLMKKEYDPRAVNRKQKKKIDKRIQVGRNDPCFCGSGKKFKKCCINKKLSHDK